MVTKLSPKVKNTFNVLRERIRTMPVGMPLPAFTELKDGLNVGQLTIQRAYDMLESQGYIARKVGKGVFVADRTQAGELAVTVLSELLMPSASPYYGLVCNALVAMTRELWSHVDLKMHFGSLCANGHDFEPPPDLINPRTAAKLRGVFTFHPLHQVEKELEALGVPLILLGTHGKGACGYSVAFDSEYAVRQYMTVLAESGCRRVGILGNVCFDDANEPHYLEAVMNTARSMSLEVRPEWAPVTMCKTRITDSVGYEQFMHLWRLEDKPDGLVVLDDVVCKGVLRACLQLGVDLPRDVQLVTHTNKHVDLPYHKPITRVEFDAHEMARHAINITKNLLRHQEPEVRNVLVPGMVVKGETTVEVAPQCGRN
jgi:DNA-binding LacI/PurR family transcriptional regulator